MTREERRAATRLRWVAQAGAVHALLDEGRTVAEVAVELGVDLRWAGQLAALGDWVLGRREDLPALKR